MASTTGATTVNNMKAGSTHVTNGNNNTTGSRRNAASRARLRRRRCSSPSECSASATAAPSVRLDRSNSTNSAPLRPRSCSSRSRLRCVSTWRCWRRSKSTSAAPTGPASNGPIAALAEATVRPLCNATAKSEAAIGSASSIERRRSRRSALPRRRRATMASAPAARGTSGESTTAIVTPTATRTKVAIVGPDDRPPGRTAGVRTREPRITAMPLRSAWPSTRRRQDRARRRSPSSRGRCRS